MWFFCLSKSIDFDGSYLPVCDRCFCSSSNNRKIEEFSFLSNKSNPRNQILQINKLQSVLRKLSPNVLGQRLSYQL